MNNQYESTGSFIDQAYDFFEEKAKETVIEPDFYIKENEKNTKVENIEITITLQDPN